MQYRKGNGGLWWGCELARLVGERQGEMVRLEDEISGWDSKRMKQHKGEIMKERQRNPWSGWLSRLRHQMPCFLAYTQDMYWDVSIPWGVGLLCISFLSHYCMYAQLQPSGCNLVINYYWFFLSLKGETAKVQDGPLYNECTCWH